MCKQDKYTLTVWEWSKPLEDTQFLPPIPNRIERDARYPQTSDSKWIVEVKFFSGEVGLYKRVLYFTNEPPAYDTKWLSWWERFWYTLKK